jgi:hypothetical protein
MLGRPSMQDVRKGFQDVNHAADAEVFFQFFDASTAANMSTHPLGGITAIIPSSPQGRRM